MARHVYSFLGRRFALPQARLGVGPAARTVAFGATGCCMTAVGMGRCRPPHNVWSEYAEIKWSVASRERLAHAKGHLKTLGRRPSISVAWGAFRPRW